MRRGISGRRPELVLQPLLGPEQLTPLAADAKADGRAMVTRLIAEWVSGENRFALPGEGAYGARIGSRICAVGGLNRDPTPEMPRSAVSGASTWRLAIGETALARLW